MIKMTLTDGTVVEATPEELYEFDRLGEAESEPQADIMPVKFAHETEVATRPLHRGDIVRVTVDNARWSRNEDGEIGEITEVDNEGDAYDLPYFVDVAGREGSTMLAWHSAESIELVVPFELRSDE